MSRTKAREADLSRFISVDGETVRIREATAEEFDQYIYDVLGKMYDNEQYKALRRYGRSFDYDWSVLGNRILALDILYQINFSRKNAKPPKPKIALFAEEVRRG